MAFMNTAQTRKFPLIFWSVNFMETSLHQIVTTGYPSSLQSVRFYKIYWPEFQENFLISRLQNKLKYHSEFQKFQFREIMVLLSETYCGPCQTSMMEFFWENN